MFSIFEKSNSDGRPVFLYELTWGAKIWRYTSADRDVTFGVEDDDVTPIVWTAVAIKDEGVTLGAGMQDFKVTCPANLPVVDLFRSTPPAEPIALRAIRYHIDDPDEQPAVYWVGTVGNIKRENRGKAVIFGLPTNIRRTGLRLAWERNCPHMLYDQDCKVNRDDFKVETTISGLTGTRIFVASIGAFDGEAFAGGFIEWEADAAPAIDRRGIEAFIDGTEFQIFGSTDRIYMGMPVTLYLGCDLLPQTCAARFNNLANFGGINFMPGKSPFDGDPVF